jgi:hypothetical protein
MKLTMLRKDRVDDGRNDRGLTVVGKPAQIVQWPGVETTERESVSVDLRAKRFTDQKVEPIRYEGTVAIGDRSISEIVSSLASSLSSVEELRHAMGREDHLVLNIQIRL